MPKTPHAIWSRILQTACNLQQALKSVAFVDASLRSRHRQESKANLPRKSFVCVAVFRNFRLFRTSEGSVNKRNTFQTFLQVSGRLQNFGPNRMQRFRHQRSVCKYLRFDLPPSVLFVPRRSAPACLPFGGHRIADG